MNIIYKKTNDLIPYINNPRDNKIAVDAVASSIKNFGFKQPIVIDQKNEIIVGHTRLLAAKKLNLKEVPCLVVDDLNEAQIKAYRIADNKVAELASWKMELLNIELEELENIQFDMSEFGFEIRENFDIDEFLQDNNSESTNEREAKRCPHCGELLK